MGIPVLHFKYFKSFLLVSSLTENREIKRSHPSDLKCRPLATTSKKAGRHGREAFKMQGLALVSPEECSGLFGATGRIRSIGLGSQLNASSESQSALAKAARQVLAATTERL